MEIRLILALIRRWLWLLVLGTILGIGIGFYLTFTQTTSYTSSSRLMVWQSDSSGSTLNSAYYRDVLDARLAEIYADLITTEPIRAQVSENLGYSFGDLSVTQQDQFITLQIRDANRERPQQILSTFVDVFIEFNDTFQSGQFTASEETLSNQLTQLEQQIAQTENELNTLTQFSLENQVTVAENNLVEINQQIGVLREEIIQLTSPSNNIEQDIQLAQQTNQLARVQAEYDAYQSAYQAAIIDGDTAQQNAISNELTRLSSDVFTLQTNILQITQQDNTAQELEVANKNDQLEQLLITRQAYLDIIASNDVGNSGDINQAQQLRLNQLQTSLNLYQQLYNNLLGNYESVRLARLQGTPSIIEIEQPSAASEVSPPSYVLIGALLGLFLAGGIAFGLEFIDDTVKSAEDAKHTYQAPVIGYIAEHKDIQADGMFTSSSPRSPIAEAFRNIRTNLEFAEVDHGLKTILIASANASEGKTTVATNLAIVIAQSGKRVLVIDADMRRPRLHRALGLENYSGLSDLFRANPSIKEVLQKTSVPNFYAITSGSLPPNPAELLASERMSTLLTEMQKLVDVVIVDSPPFILSDAYILASKVDGVVVAVQSGRTQRTAANSIRENLERAGANVVGIVLNRINNQTPGYYDYSTYGYYQSKYYELDQPKRNNRGLSRQITSLFNGNGSPSNGNGRNGTNGASKNGGPHKQNGKPDSAPSNAPIRENNE